LVYCQGLSLIREELTAGPRGPDGPAGPEAPAAPWRETRAELIEYKCTAASLVWLPKHTTVETSRLAAISDQEPTISTHSLSTVSRLASGSHGAGGTGWSWGSWCSGSSRLTTVSLMKHSAVSQRHHNNHSLQRLMFKTNNNGLYVVMHDVIHLIHYRCVARTLH